MAQRQRKNGCVDGGARQQGDAELVRLVLAGDRKAQHRLAEVARCVAEPRVRSTLARALRSGPLPMESLKEDAVQELLLTLFANRSEILRTWDPTRNERLAPFLGGIAKNVTLNLLAKYRRKSINETLATPEELEPMMAGKPTMDLDRRLANRQTTEQLMCGLDPRDQAMIWAYFFEGQSAREMSERFERTEHAIHLWAARIRQRLRRRLAELQEPEPT